MQVCTIDLYKPEGRLTGGCGKRFCIEHAAILNPKANSKMKPKLMKNCCDQCLPHAYEAFVKQTEWIRDRNNHTLGAGIILTVLGGFLRITWLALTLFALGAMILVVFVYIALIKKVDLQKRYLKDV